MDSSPKGREIKELVGTPETIISRGNAITELGEQMVTSAALLKSIADGASGQRGLAVDKLQEVVGDCHAELKLAGERYKPSGPVLVTYGEAVAELQPLIRTAVSNCESKWETVTAKRTAVWDASTDFYLPPADDAPEDAKTPAELREEAVGDAQDAADDAYDKWDEQADIFDEHYDTWEKAFNKAAEDLTDATEGGITDSTWDNIDGFVAGALEVLKWVGLGLAILGVIIGGPFLAALAAIVAIATLLLTLYSFARGNSTWGDLAFAVIGVIPFGSLGKLFGGNKLGFADDMLGGLLTQSSRLDIVSDLGRIGRMPQGFLTGFGRANGFFPGIARGLRGGFMQWAGPNGAGAGNMLSRLMTGQNMAHWGDDGLDGLSVLGSVWGDGGVKTVFGIPDTLLDLHNDWFPSPELEQPLFGSPKR
jgi:hypothetical protein